MDYHSFVLLFTILWCGGWYGSVPWTAIGPHATFVERTFSALQLSSLVHAHFDNPTVPDQETLETASSISSMLLPELENVLEKIKDVEMNRSAVVFYYPPTTVTSVVPWTVPTSGPKHGGAGMPGQFQGTSASPENPFLATILSIISDSPWAFSWLLFSFLAIIGLARNSSRNSDCSASRTKQYRSHTNDSGPSYAELLEKVNAIERSTARNNERVNELHENFSTVNSRARELNTAVEGLQNNSRGQSTQSTGQLSAVDNELLAIRQSLGPRSDGLNYQQMIGELEKAKIDRRDSEEKFTTLKNKINSLKQVINSKPDMSDFQNVTRDQEENALFHTQLNTKFDTLLDVLRQSINSKTSAGVSEELVAAMAKVRRETSSDTNDRLSPLDDRVKFLEQTMAKNNELQGSMDRLEKEIGNVKEMTESKTTTGSQALTTQLGTLSAALQNISTKLDSRELETHACPISADFHTKLDTLLEDFKHIEKEVKDQRPKPDSHQHREKLPETQEGAGSSKGEKADGGDEGTLSEIRKDLTKLALDLMKLDDKQEENQADLDSKISKLKIKIGKQKSPAVQSQEEEVSASSTAAENDAITQFRADIEKVQTDLQSYNSRLEEVWNSRASNTHSLQEEFKNLKTTVDGVNERVLDLELLSEASPDPEKPEDAERSTASQADLEEHQSQLQDFKNEIEGKLAGLEKAISEENVGIKPRLESLETTIGNAKQGIDNRGEEIEANGRKLEGLETRMSTAEKAQKEARSELKQLGESVTKIENGLPELVEETTDALVDRPKSTLFNLRNKVDKVHNEMSGLSSRVGVVEKRPQQPEGSASTPNPKKGSPLDKRFEDIERTMGNHRREINDQHERIGETSKLARSHETRVNQAFGLSSSCYDTAEECKKVVEKFINQKVAVVAGEHEKVLHLFKGRSKNEGESKGGEGSKGGEDPKGSGGHTESGSGENIPEEAPEEGAPDDGLDSLFDDDLDSLFDDDSLAEEESPPVKSAPTMGKYAVVSPAALEKSSSKPGVPSTPTPSIASGSVLDSSNTQKESKGKEKDPYAHISIHDPSHPRNKSKEKDPYANISIHDPNHPRNKPKEAQPENTTSVLDPSNTQQKGSKGKEKDPYAHISIHDPSHPRNKPKEAQSENDKKPEPSNKTDSGNSASDKKPMNQDDNSPTGNSKVQIPGLGLLDAEMKPDSPLNAPETASTDSKGKSKEKTEPDPQGASASSKDNTATGGTAQKEENKTEDTETKKTAAGDDPSQKDTKKDGSSGNGKGPALDTQTPNAPITSRASTPATPSPNTPVSGSGRGKRNKNKRGGK